MWRILLVFGVLSAAACGEQAVAPVAVDAPAFAWMNNPDNGNPRIYRYESGIVICWTDPSNGLRVCVGTEPLGGGTEPDCGLQTAIGPMELQEIGAIDPVELFRSEIHAVYMGEGWVTVRNMAVPGECFTRQLVAEGPGRLQWTDNDVFGTWPDEANANAWGYTAHGVLTTPAGETVRFHGLIRWRYNNQVGLKVLAATVQLD